MSGGKLYKSIPRVPAEQIDKLRGIGVADMHDALGVDWRALTLMRGDMRPILPDTAIVGQAVTAYCPPGDNMMMHCALNFSQPGDVLVISNGGVENGAVWGENATIYARKKGLAGVVADAPVRDLAGLRERGLPVWSSIVSVSTPAKSKIGNLNTPIQCGGIIVNPGDIVMADADGVLVLPIEIALPAAERARARVENDKLIHKLIEEGGSIYDFLKLDKALKDMGVTLEEGSWNGR